MYTAYDLEHIRKGFKEETPLFYVLTNSRSLKQKETEKLHLQESEVEAVRWMDLKECQKAVREGTIPNCIDIRELEMIEKAWSAGEKQK